VLSAKVEGYIAQRAPSFSVRIARKNGYQKDVINQRRQVSGKRVIGFCVMKFFWVQWFSEVDNVGEEG
jgi:hypothetical protein